MTWFFKNSSEIFLFERFLHVFYSKATFFKHHTGKSKHAIGLISIKKQNIYAVGRKGKNNHRKFFFYL